MKIKMGEHLVLLGTNGSGKTYFFRHVIEPEFDRLLVVDTEDREFSDLKLIQTRNGDTVAKAIPRDKKFRWRWVPPPTEEVEQMDNLSNRLLDREECEGMTLYIDEATDFADAHTISPWLKALFRKARKRRQSIIIGSQRP